MVTASSPAHVSRFDLANGYAIDPGVPVWVGIKPSFVGANEECPLGFLLDHVDDPEGSVPAAVLVCFSQLLVPFMNLAGLPHLLWQTYDSGAASALSSCQPSYCPRLH